MFGSLIEQLDTLVSLHNKKLSSGSGSYWLCSNQASSQIKNKLLSIGIEQKKILEISDQHGCMRLDPCLLNSDVIHAIIYTYIDTQLKLKVINKSQSDVMYGLATYVAENLMHVREWFAANSLEIEMVYKLGGDHITGNTKALINDILGLNIENALKSADVVVAESAHEKWKPIKEHMMKVRDTLSRMFCTTGGFGTNIAKEITHNGMHVIVHSSDPIVQMVHAQIIKSPRSEPYSSIGNTYEKSSNTCPAFIETSEYFPSNYFITPSNLSATFCPRKTLFIPNDCFVTEEDIASVIDWSADVIVLPYINSDGTYFKSPLLERMRSEIPRKLIAEPKAI
ncbi:hypothetical protein [Vibrio sp. D431a]|uniref:hypothetical protein n=1 Tax=Vibrio sp. D431a TaxID=2837388 RepID=UPI002555C88D|nr:hypothetical protein [Vibrio sp. D431a]MDK9789833.1 hypothetical protein [Vibrio sp. D431a]